MKQLFENWRKYLKEDSDLKSFPFQIYCDMDGVLVDLPAAILKAAHQDTENEDYRKAVMGVIASKITWKTAKKNKELAKGVKFIHKLLSNDADFWVNIPKMPDATKLWNFISPHNPYILSAPWDEASAKGKIIWLSGLTGNLDPVPPKSKIILTHNKHEYAINEETGSPNVLIDDMEKYIKPWSANGGIAIHHTSANSTIKQLKNLME